MSLNEYIKKYSRYEYAAPQRQDTGVPTLRESALAYEGFTADIIGHEKQTMTYGLYSGGTSVKQRKEAIVQFEKLMLEIEAAAT